MISVSTWRLPLLSATALVAIALAPTRPAEAVCVGDCAGDGRVSIVDVQACVNLGAGLPAPACAAADQNGDGTVEPNEVDGCLQSFLNGATCPMVFTPAPTRTATAPPPATLTATPPPATATNTLPPLPTATNTLVPTNTPVPTATTAPIVSHLCTLDRDPPSDSQLAIYIEALPVPLSYPFSGGTINFNTGGSVATCDILSLNPVNIPGIGFVCIAPATGCPAGERHCAAGAGPPLGISAVSDGNIGACTSNTQCDALAATQCGGAANVLSAACTGFCSAGTEGVCTNDVNCAPNNGACNGPNALPTANRNRCQVTCVNDAAHGPSDSGDFQCNLGANLIVETGAPCDGTDTLILVGQTCIPFSTQRANAQIIDGNFTGANVPNPVGLNDLSGSPLACSTVDTSTLTGLIAVGTVNFFGSSLGDLSTGLKVTCQ